MFKSFSHKEGFCDKLHTIYMDYAENLECDYFTEAEAKEFRMRLVALGKQVNEEAGIAGMHALFNYIGTDFDDNFGHYWITTGFAAELFKMLVERIWSGIGEWQC